MATFSKNRVFGKLINQYEINGVSYAPNTTGSITVDGSGATSVAEAAGTSVYATAANLPVSGNSEGDQAFVSGNNRLYIWNGSGWYNIALINTNPSISSIVDSDNATGPFILSTEGIPVTITITATDPEGLPITYTAETDSGFDGLATLAQDSSIFTVTPFSTDSATFESGTITFRVSDGVNIASSVQTFTLTFLSPYWDETVLSIGTNSTNGIANSTFVDRSTNALTVTPSGTPRQTAFHPYLENWSVKFDNETEKLATTGMTAAGNDFTLECWIYPTLFADYNTIYDDRISDIDPNGFVLGLTAAAKVYFYTNNIFQISSTAALSTNKWYHIALVRSGSGSNNVKIYIDGVADATTATYTTEFTRTAPSIGCDWATRSFLDYVGYISNLRLTSGGALYTAGFTPSTSALTTSVSAGTVSLLTCQSNRFIDNSGNNHTVTLSSTPEISAFNPFGQGSEYAVGENKGSVYTTDNSDYIEVTATQDDLLSTSGAFTIETWIYFKSFNTGQYSVPIFRFSDTVENFIWRATPTTAASTSTNVYQNDANNRPWGISGTIFGTVYLNTWHHFAISKESNNTYHFYIDGTRVHTSTNSQAFSDLNNLQLGFDLHGYTSDFRTTKSALYTIATITPPTAPVGNTNASLYLPFDNAGIFDKTGNHTLTAAGNASTSTTQTKYANTSIYFDGTGDTLNTSSVADFNLSSGNWTIEGWTWGVTDTVNQRLFALEGSSQSFALIRPGSERLQWNYIGSAALITSGNNTAPINVWVHFALVSNSGTITLYVNGTSAGTTTTYPQNSNTQLTIAGSLLRFVETNTNAYIENFQILKGIAKYTGNFTPPTATQGRTYQAP